METQILELAFLSEDNRKLTISVDEPNSDLNELEVTEAMNSIIANNIFTLSGSSIIKIGNARIVTKTIKDII